MNKNTSGAPPNSGGTGPHLHEVPMIAIGDSTRHQRKEKKSAQYNALPSLQYASGKRAPQVFLDGKNVTPKRLSVVNTTNDFSDFSRMLKAKEATRMHDTSGAGNATMDAPAAADVQEIGSEKIVGNESQPISAGDQEINASIKPSIQNSSTEGNEGLQNSQLVLSETPTIKVLSIHSVCVALDSASYGKLAKRSQDYEKLVANQENRPQRMINSWCQTFHGLAKSKEVEANFSNEREKGVLTYPYDICLTQQKEVMGKYDTVKRCYDEEVKRIIEVLASQDAKLQPTGSVAQEEAATYREKAGLDTSSSLMRNAGASSHDRTDSPTSKNHRWTLFPGMQKRRSMVRKEFRLYKQLYQSSPRQRRTEASEKDERPAADKEPHRKGNSLLWKLDSDTLDGTQFYTQLCKMENALWQNIYHKQLLLFKNNRFLYANRSLRLSRTTRKLLSSRIPIDKGFDKTIEQLKGDDAKGKRGSTADTRRSTTILAGPVLFGKQRHSYVEGLETDDGDSVTELFQLSLENDMSATCVEWNPVNSELLAVGHRKLWGTHADKHGNMGYVAVWSIKNGFRPERVIGTPSGVVCIGFSPLSPSILAAGMQNGLIAVWHLQVTDTVLIEGFNFHSSRNKGHTEAVLDLKWVDRGVEHNPREVLTTASYDGHVIQWNLGNRFETLNSIYLKPSPFNSMKSKNPHSLLSTPTKTMATASLPLHVSALCIEFNPLDHTTYLLGTDNGSIFLCSTTYNEQYLQSFEGHAAPVLRVSYNPFDPDYFISCSSDWTIRLWSIEKTDKELISFCSPYSYSAVNDVAWSPINSSCFAACMNDGRIEVWDMYHHSFDPLSVYHIRKFSKKPAAPLSLRFARHAPVLAVTDLEGCTSILHIDCIELEEANPSIRKQRLKQSLEKSKVIESVSH